MAKPVSMEIRAAIVKHMEAGVCKKDIAKWLFVSIWTISRIWNKYTTVGSYEPESPNNCGRKPMVSDETMNQVVSKLKEVPDIAICAFIVRLTAGKARLRTISG